MAVEWGVIWSAVDDEEVHATDANKVAYTKTSAIEDIKSMPWMKGVLVSRFVDDWRVVRTGEVALPQMLREEREARDRHVELAVQSLERARALVRPED